MAGTPSSQSDSVADVSSRLQDSTGAGGSDVVFVDLEGGSVDGEPLGSDALGGEAPFAVRQASTTTSGVGSWLRDRYPGVEFGRPMILGAMAGLFVTVGLLAWLSFGGDDMVDFDEAPASGSAAADGSGSRAVFDNESASATFTSPASKRLSRASGAAGKEEALAGLQARRELRELAEEAEAAGIDPDADNGDSSVAATNPDNGVAIGDGSDDSGNAVADNDDDDDDESSTGDANLAGPSVTTVGGSATVATSGSSITTNGIGQSSSTSTSGNQLPSNPTTPSTSGTTASTQRPSSTASSSTQPPTSSSVTSAAPTTAAPTTAAPTTAAPTTAAPTTTVTTVTTATTASTTTTTAPPVATDLVASPVSGSSYSLNDSVVFASNFIASATEYCWRFSSGIRGNRCSTSTSFAVSGADFRAGSVTVTATARTGDDVVARESITIIFTAANEEAEIEDEDDDSDSKPGRRGGGRRPR